MLTNQAASVPHFFYVTSFSLQTACLVEHTILNCCGSGLLPDSRITKPTKSCKTTHVLLLAPSFQRSSPALSCLTEVARDWVQSGQGTVRPRCLWKKLWAHAAAPRSPQTCHCSHCHGYWQLLQRLSSEPQGRAEERVPESAWNRLRVPRRAASGTLQASGLA